MITDRFSGNVYLAVGSTDMRKAINGLSMLVEQAMDLNPFSGDLFVFCNRQRTIIKILYWDNNGFCLWSKRLEKHRFKWPAAADDVVAINIRQLSWLLAGLDLTSAHERLYFSAVA
jgi:transposase